MVFARRRRHLERYIEIGRILAKHGWAHLLWRLGLSDILRVRKHPKGVDPGPVETREALEELGPTFIKLGQVLSTRPDIIPPEYIAELSKLQDAAPPVPIQDIRRVIQEEFGAPVQDVYASFQEEPLASASLGQTHLATLHDDTPVVIKIQRPGISRTIDVDLEIITSIVRFLEQHIEIARIYSFSELLDEFNITIHQEQDYIREGHNGDQLKENLADEHYVKIASTIWDYTTPKVLTQERINGVKITDTAELEARGYDLHEIARNLTRSYYKMIFVDGYFHGDPHPGNLFVLEDNVIGLLDYGITGKLDRELKSYVTTLFAEYADENSKGFAEVFLAVGIAPLDLDRRTFARDIDRLLRQYYGGPLREVQIGEVMQRALRIGASHRVRLPANLGLLVKVILGMEGIDRTLDPNYDLTSDLRPFLEKSVRSEFSYSTLKEELYHTMLSFKSLILELPHRTSDVLDNMARGTFRIIFKHEGLEVPFREIDKSANRLSFALIASATIVGSALILSAQIGPYWNDLSIIGLFGFGISFVFAVWLMISIIRTGKLW